ncbi:hypothetical protein HY488_00725 [Candidatus Woesearchaeota archaeon]|nr:hypothetical protein [Candidatus Woesearchaeota archaeon]
MRSSIVMVYLIFLLSIAMLLSACLQLLQPREAQTGSSPETTAPELVFGKVNTFRDGFMEMKKIDEKYNTDFHKERLGKLVVDSRDMPAMEEDIYKLLEHITGTRNIDFEKVSHKRNKTETDLVLLFIATRLKMLESELYFQLGYKYGNAGLVGDGFFCSEQPYIFESLDAFNASVRKGLDASYYMDVMLTQTNEITHALVGIDEGKPEFYKIPFQTMGAQLRKNHNLVTKYCANQTGKDTYVMVENTDIDDKRE